MAVTSYRADGRGNPVCAPELHEADGAAERLLQEAERYRETCWLGSGSGLDDMLRRRAFLAVSSLPVLPGRAILEVGAGRGLWTAHLAAILENQNNITAAVFNKDVARVCSARNLPNTRCVHVSDLANQFPAGSFDYILGTDILTGDLCTRILAAAYRWLRPGGRVIFFGPNTSNPWISFQEAVRSGMRGNRSRSSQHSVSQKQWTEVTSQQGFDDIEVTPCEVIRPRNSAAGQAISLILEHAPVTREFSETLTFMAAKPGNLPEIPAEVNWATHQALFGAVSVVVPCHNEETNIGQLVRTLLGMYGDYIQEIVIVDDNSTDRTAEVTEAIASSEPRVRLLRRTPPNGVGRALRDGYAAARGRYILSIDCDFINIVSEFRRLFDVVVAGHDGAIGSRFSSESTLIRYPFLKILSNRSFHWVLNLLLGKSVRDISNNLKLYRADIFKNLDIEENHFAANAETGLKPLLMGYDIREVPTSWINRTAEMGKSSFDLLTVGPDYLRVLLRITWRAWRGRYRVSRAN
jgi:dolichol-phosphate mannosyltransferase